MKKILLIALSLVAAFASRAADDRMIVVSTASNYYISTDIAKYRTIADMAKEIGATHVECSQVEPSMWQWNQNRYDPYPCWSMHRGSLFKFILPKELEPYIPKDYVARNYAMLKERGKILSKLGLKGYFNTMDPAYLPEQAYLDHPAWRGPRCDQARRARTEYYAPCIDNKEMRSMYVDAIGELCKVIPVEMVNILCNDSGAGLCWYQHLYPGANGPSDCKHTSVEDRALDYLNMWQEGAAKAGVDFMRVNLGHTYDIDNIIPRLRPGQSLNNKTADGGAGFMTIGCSGWYNDGFAPAFCMPRMGLIARQLQAAQKSKAPINISFRSTDEVDMYRFMKMYLKNPIGDGPMNRYKALHALAVTFVGEEQAETLVQIWDNIEDIAEIIKPYSTGGTIYELGTQHQRWLTRPFVAFPQELQGEDRSYWRDFLFQAQTETEAMDMTNLQAHKWLEGYGGFFLLNNSSRQMQSILESTLKLAGKIESKGVDKESMTYLKGLCLKLRLFSCIVRNGINAVEFQWIMDTAGDTKSTADKTQKIRWQGDEELVRMNQITRDEIDNCHEIIAILDEADAAGIPVIVKVDKKEFEQVLYLGPDVQDQLRHKVSIMEAHRRDFLRIWRSKNL